MKVPYSNTTDKIQHIGPTTVMPGQTREIEERDLLAFTDATLPGKDDDEADAPLSELSAFLQQPVKAIADALPGMSAGELDLLEAEESAAEKPRKGVLAAIAEARLQLASQTSDSELQQFIDSLPGMTDEELAEHLELYSGEADSEAWLQAVIAEQEKRAGDA